MNFYYAIIGDALHSIRKTKNKHKWKFAVYVYFTYNLALNILAFFISIQIFTGYNIDIIITQVAT